MWHFLYKPASQGEVISRELLLKQMKYDYRIVKLLLEHTISYLEEQSRPKEVQDIIVNVTEMTEEDIEKVRSKQSHPLSFLLMVLTSLGKLNEAYLNSVRSLVGKVAGYCLEWHHEDAVSFVYLLLSHQLVKGHNEWLTRDQLTHLAAHVYAHSAPGQSYLNLKFLLY